MSFDADVARFVKRARDGANKLTRGVELELFRSAIMDTPVDTGRLRGNWQYSHGRPVDQERDAEDQSGVRTTSEMQSGVLSAPWPRKSYLRNNLPYAIRIEEGHSTIKAPQGMVRRNLRRIAANLRSQIRRLR
ncbi:MAG: hypothetical protein CMJ58_12665 [Planctomycetaceae bacterium]|nr:hypothetical protein [Planctomycetaceae bacterium]